MAAPEIVGKSCLCISDVSCYELVKDFSGPAIAILVAFFTVITTGIAGGLISPIRALLRAPLKGDLLSCITYSMLD